MGVSFTPQQQRVIDVRDCNVLVSAAAGSGKTAVLTERIVKMVSDESRPVSIDRLLVVTFTNAAAAEMRERIGAAITARLESEPDNEHLQKQAALVHHAQITTIDSFCMFVIRNNFNDIGLDPGFRVADEGERKLLQQEVMDAFLEEAFESGEEAFQNCVEYFSTGSRDKAIEGNILKLYEFAMSHPWPGEWLQERKKDYLIQNAEDLEEMECVRFGLDQTNRILADCMERISACLLICQEPDGPYMYGELLEKEQEQFERLLPLTTYNEGFSKLGSVVFGRLPSKKDDSVSPAKRELIQKVRKEVKDLVSQLRERYFPAPGEKMAENMRRSLPAVETLIDLTLGFREAFSAKKREANLLDFDDIEHFALRILCQKEEGTCHPTQTALDYRAYFAEILIDEYQDSNLVQELLLESISGEAEGRYNRFMVGDVKQSIYKFRLARPEIFMEKYDSYGEEGSCQKIDLHKNFRSRKEVIDSVNDLFYRIMGKDLGGIFYDEQAALYPGAVYPPFEGKKESPVTELLLVSDQQSQRQEEDASQTDQEESSRKKEARAIASRIRELVGSYPVTDSGTLRPAAYRDIVILLRSTAGWDEEFREVFKEEGIPAHSSSKAGYFSAPEIQTLLQLLRVLDNPRQDIPLFGLLKSVFGNLSDAQLTRIRTWKPKASEDEKREQPQTGTSTITGETEEKSGKNLLFIDKVEAYLEAHSESELLSVKMSEETGDKEINDNDLNDIVIIEKLKEFMAFLNRYRDKAMYLPIHDLLRELLEQSGYLHYVAALPGGEQRRANVEILLEKAVSFQQTSYYGLFHFIRYIEQLEKYEVDYGEANILDENADVVRIMSIHKSKGLEFPICFVSGLSKRFNMQDVTGRMIADVDMGIGVDYVNHRERFLTGTLRKNLIAAKMKQDNLGEELRVLYVALTRAKEKLIMTGYVKEPEKRLEGLQSLVRRQSKLLPYTDLLSAADYLDFILPALADHPAMEALLEEVFPGNTSPPRQRDTEEERADCFIHIVTEEELEKKQMSNQLDLEGARRRLVYEKTMTEPDNKKMTTLSKKLEYSYEHANLQGLYTKTTVSELKKASLIEQEETPLFLYEEPQIIPYFPKFMQKEEALVGAGRGSAFHKVMELIDFTEPDTFEEQFGKMKESKRLEEAYAQAVPASEIQAFLKTGLAERMVRAAKKGKLFKERPFVLGIGADELKADFPADETVLIQGIIDLYFEEDGELVVADYKTDRVKKPEELAVKYSSQLAYYARALEQLTGKKVKEKIIYSFGLKAEIMV